MKRKWLYIVLSSILFYINFDKDEHEYFKWNYIFLTSFFTFLVRNLNFKLFMYLYISSITISEQLLYIFYLLHFIFYISWSQSVYCNLIVILIIYCTLRFRVTTYLICKNFIIFSEKWGGNVQPLCAVRQLNMELDCFSFLRITHITGYLLWTEVLPGHQTLIQDSAVITSLRYIIIIYIFILRREANAVKFKIMDDRG